jgi:hypothetical protein
LDYLGGGVGILPSDDPLLRGVANINLWLKMAITVLETGTAAALGQAELVDRLLALASEEDGDLAEPVGELGGA